MPFGPPSGEGGGGITLTKSQATPVGSVEVRTSALLSTAAQALGRGQEMPLTGNPLPAETTCHSPAPLVGFVELIICPALPVTQSAGEGQEMPLRLVAPPGWPTTLHADAGPAGLVETAMLPSLPTAAQKVVVGQETPRKSSGDSSCVTVQAEASPVGSPETRRAGSIAAEPVSAGGRRFGRSVDLWRGVTDAAVSVLQADDVLELRRRDLDDLRIFDSLKACGRRAVSSAMNRQGPLPRGQRAR